MNESGDEADSDWSGDRPWYQRVDPRLRALVESDDPSDPGAKRVRVLVKFHGDASRLRALGLELGSAAGTVATATVALDDVPAVASAPEVVFIELSRPLASDVA